MIFNKTLFASILAISLGGLCSQALADGLTVINNTDADSTSAINDGLCSTIFGSEGITKAHTTHVIDSKLIALACTFTPSDCKADIYMNDDCSGPIVATATFNVKTGIQNLTVNSELYALNNGAFDITINDKF